MKITLYDCLMAQSLRTIEAISRARSFPFDTHATKADSARRLANLLLAPDAVCTAWESLSDEARAALRELARRPDPMPRRDFIFRYGHFRPYKPWRPDAPRRPWLDPISPTETLIYAGLIFPLNLGTTKRPVPVIALPDEVRTALDPFLEVTPLPGAAPAPVPPSRPAIDRQVFALLSFLNNQDVRPLWDRWLPPVVARRLAERLNFPTGSTIRSELHIPRLAFVHYLAERAGLLDTSGPSSYLKPTLLVHNWLASSPAGRLLALWDAWLQRDKEAPDLWRRYRLPSVGEDDPLARFHGLLRALKTLLSVQPTPLTAFLEELRHYDPVLFRSQAYYGDWAELSAEVREDYRRAVGHCLEKLLTGPLAWFGVIEAANQQIGKTAIVSLSPLGAALLRDDAASLESLLAQESAAPWLRLQAMEEPEPLIAVMTSADAPLSVLWSLEEITDPAERETGRYTVSRRSLLRALDRGHTVEDIVEQLERDSGDVLSPAVLHLLYNWAEEHGQVTLRPVMLLQTRDAALLRELARVKRIREKFTATLSARAVTVNASALDLLVRQMEKRGLHAVVERPPGTMPPVRQENISSADRVSITAALLLAHHLAHELGLRLHLPDPLLRDWEKSLSLAERDAVESWVSEVLDRLQRRYRTTDREFHPPFPVAPLIPILEEAIARGATIEIEYHPLDRPVTVRRVDPLRLEQRGRLGTDYLIAFCHLRGEERTFRLDRIGRIVNGECAN